ncbi:hypothetical protein Tco_0430925 [Tanacetum coccineum]
MEQGDSVSGERGVRIQLVSEAVETSVGDVAPLQPRRQRKRKTVIVDSGEPSHPAKKLKKDRETLCGTSVARKSMPTIQQLLAGAMQNAEVRGEPILSLPFVTSSVSATPKREDEDHTDSMARTNLQTFSPPLRFVISSDSSYHSGANIAKAEVDYVARSSAPVITTVTTVTAMVDAATAAKEAPTKPSLFGIGSPSAGETDPTSGGFLDVSSSDFLIGGIRTVFDPDFDLQKVYVSQ